MAKYREKSIEFIEAVEWTGENLKEIKKFLGTCFVEVTDDGKLRYKQCKRSTWVSWANIGEMIWLNNDFGEFISTSKENFLTDWELVEE